MESRLVVHADHRQVVTPGLANIMSQAYRCEFDVVPNCVPKGSSGFSTSGRFTSTNGYVRFLFQGLQPPGRGLEDLLQCWPSVAVNAQLVLRGPEGNYQEELKQLALKLGLDDRRVKFLPASSTDDLVTAGQDFDVGVVPYSASNINNSHCCPSELSQYMAGGLPLLVNDTSFVRHIVSEARCGVIVDFRRSALLVNAVNDLTENLRARRDMAKAASEYFERFFNWEHVSRPVYERMAALAMDSPMPSFAVWPVALPERLYVNSPNPKLPPLFRCQQFVTKLWQRVPVSIQLRVRPLLCRLLGR
jgi:glycosyltransferase involved in cell wall biosynthesis